MADLKFALLLILSLDAIMFLSSAAMLNVNPAGGNTYNCANTTLAYYGDCANYQVTQDPKTQLPGGSSSVNPTTGTTYTDTFTSVTTWLYNIPGAGVILKILSGPMAILYAIPGLPGVFTFTIGTLWYTFTFFLIISFLWGRQGEG